MKNMRLLAAIGLLLFITFNTVSCKGSSGNEPVETKESITLVDHYGALKAEGPNIVDQNGDPFAVRGMSLFWSQWGGKFYNKSCVEWLVDEWKCTVVRAAIGVEAGGYLTNPEAEYQKLKTVIDACIDLGIYVVIDWHDHNAESHLNEAKAFFDAVSSEYGTHPNIIYEIYNEPLQISWEDVVKPYAEEVIKVIRENDPDNLIVVGTPTWSQDVDKAAASPIDDQNVAYTLHFYTSIHKQWLRTRSVSAMQNGIALFVTEFGFSEASGNGIIDPVEKDAWINFLDSNNLSWCNWSVMDKDETSAALLPGAPAEGGWSDDVISESGKLVREFIQTRNADVWKELEELNN